MERYGEQEKMARQVNNARVQKENAQGRKRDAQRRYESFMNQQTDTSQYDLLENGGTPPWRLEMEKKILWQNYTKAEEEARKAEKSYNDLWETYTNQMQNAERISYEVMEMDDLDALKENQKTVVDQNQAAAIKAQNDYGAYMNQWSNTDNIDFLEGNWGIAEEEKKKQQALLQGANTATDRLTDSRESLHLMEDTYAYRYDTQLLSEMPELDKIVLLVHANRYSLIGAVNTLTSEQRALLRKSGSYGQILTNPESYLKKRGYGEENLDRLAESYIRQQNAQRMERVEETAENIGENSGFWGTVSTYPAAIVGDLMSAGTAVSSLVWQSIGGSDYHGIDVNSPGYIPMIYADTVRDTVSDNLGDGLGDVYDGLNEYADKKVAELLLGKTGSEILGMAGSFGENVRNAALSGEMSNEAVMLGIANAGVDWLTKCVPVDQLIKIDSTSQWQGIVGEIFQGAGAVAGESLDFIGELVTQTAILAENSDFYLQVEWLVLNGMDEEEAKQEVYKQYMSQIVNDIAWPLVEDALDS